MAKGAARGFAVGALGLVALQTFTSNAGSGKVAGLFGAISGGINRLMDPTVPLLPDHSAPLPPGVLKPGTGPTPGDSSPHLDTNGKLIPGDPNGSPGGYPQGTPNQQDSWSVPIAPPVTTNA